MAIDSRAIGNGKATTGAPVGMSCTASMIGFTANSGLNCADEPMATTMSPDQGSLISWEMAAFITSYWAPASVTSTSFPLPWGILCA